jgi:hypothetical protein
MDYEKEKAIREGLQRGLEGKGSSKGTNIAELFLDGIGGVGGPEPRDVERARNDAYLTGQQIKADREATERATDDYDSGSGHTRAYIYRPPKITTGAGSGDSVEGIVILVLLLVIGIMYVKYHSPTSNITAPQPQAGSQMQTPPQPPGQTYANPQNPEQTETDEQRMERLRQEKWANDPMVQENAAQRPFIVDDRKKQEETPEQLHEKFIEWLKKQEGTKETPEQLHEKFMKWLKDHPNR